MAASPLTAEELHELVAELAGALAGVLGELGEVEETPMPVGDDMAKELAERDALAATLKRLPEDVRARIRTIYVEEIAKADRGDEVAPCPQIIMDQRERVADSLEAVRLAHLRDPALWRALSGALGTWSGGWT